MIPTDTLPRADGQRAAIRRLVDKGVALKIEIADRAKKLKAINAKLAEIGIACVEELEPTEGGGNSWVARGTGYLARVTYPVAKLRDAIDASSDGFIPIRRLAGDAFRHLFEAANFFKPVDGFRVKALELKGQKDGKRLIKLCESKPQVTVNYEIGKDAEESEVA